MVDRAVVHNGSYGRSVVLTMRTSLVAHAHPQAHVLVKLSGADNSFLIGGERHALVPDRIVLVDGWQPHLYDHASDEHETEVLAIYIEQDWLQRVLGRSDVAFSANSVAVTEPERRELLGLAQASSAGLSRECGLVEELLAASVRGIVRNLVREQIRTSMDFRIRKTIADLSQDFGSFKTLEEVARRNGISRPHMFSLFRRYTDMTPQMFYNMCRMEAALRRLADSGESIGEISDDLGFSAQSNFTRFFRQHQGVSPRTYRLGRLVAA